MVLAKELFLKEIELRRKHCGIGPKKEMISWEELPDEIKSVYSGLADHIHNILTHRTIDTYRTVFPDLPPSAKEVVNDRIVKLQKDLK